MKHALELGLVVLCLAAVSAGALVYVNHSGWTLYYGDAEAHLNIARRMVDSRTPGYDQIGTSWLPLPHLLTLTLVSDDRLWRSGLAGAIPSAVCFVIACVFLFAAVRRASKSSSVAFGATGLLALNPNVLYLQATPMTEPVFLAASMALFYCTILFRDTQSFGAVIGAGLAAMLATLSRYEGWFLIPFVTLYFLFAARRRKLIVAVVFGAVAALGPLYWLAHNWWLYSNALEFYNGPYSAQAIYRTTGTYPGDHDYRKAWLFYRTMTEMFTGWGVLMVAAIGLLGALWNRLFWPLAFASITPVFYLWSMHSGGTPVFVPQLWFGSYYNTRYGITALPLLAIAAGSLVLLVSKRWRPFVAIAVVASGVAPWLYHPQPDDWVCWKESKVNSDQRRAWTREAADLLRDQYRRGTGIFTSFGDLAGIYREAGIPFRQALHDGNNPAWIAATVRPDLFLHEEWAVAISGDSVATTVQRATFRNGPRYHLVKTIILKGAPVIEIYKRD
ncbi:MAG TPA: glycosyltransferase family 39 protein [Bryobacteraceae bacterium]|nr:glycosyltransferase family 39 protein [Bryobacteraceae bacterium]